MTQESDYKGINRKESDKLKKKKTKKNKYRIPVISVIIIALFVINGLIGRYIVFQDPYLTSLSDKNLEPFILGGKNIAYIFGTDYLGRDVLSRIMIGSRISLYVAVVAIIVGGGIGTILGLFAGYIGGAFDSVLMRVCDAMLAFPSIILAMLLGIVLGSGFSSVVLAIALSIWTRYAKIIRGQVLSIKNNNYILQEQLIGASVPRILFKHILPGLWNILIVMIVQDIGYAILTEASLSFLGLSVQPPEPTLGAMVSEGRNTFDIAWWVSVFPSGVIILTVIAFNYFGEWLKKVLQRERKVKVV